MTLNKWTVDWGDWLLPLNEDECFRVLNAEGEVVAQCTEQEEAELCAAAPQLLRLARASRAIDSEIAEFGQVVSSERFSEFQDALIAVEATGVLA